MEESEEKTECARAFCHSEIESWEIVCKECWEEYRKVQDWMAEQEALDFEWQAIREERETRPCSEHRSGGGRHESK